MNCHNIKDLWKAHRGSADERAAVLGERTARLLQQSGTLSLIEKERKRRNAGAGAKEERPSSPALGSSSTPPHLTTKGS